MKNVRMFSLLMVVAFAVIPLNAQDGDGYNSEAYERPVRVDLVRDLTDYIMSIEDDNTRAQKQSEAKAMQQPTKYGNLVSFVVINFGGTEYEIPEDEWILYRFSKDMLAENMANRVLNAQLSADEVKKLIKTILTDPPKRVLKVNQ